MMDARLHGLKVFVRTFGCQMNESDSEWIAGLLLDAGAIPASGPEEADIVIVNTCAVRRKSEEKLFSYLGRLAGMKKARGLVLGVVGCVAQVRQDEVRARAPAVDLIVGPDNYSDLPELIARAAETPIMATGQSPVWKERGPAAPRRTEPWSAYVTVMEGCDNFCTYCIVPFSRGRERYRPMSRILAEVRSAAEGGALEVTLLGQNVNSYRDPETGVPLSGLLDRVATVPGIEWLRFLASHPKSFGDDLIRAMADNPKVCRQLHLPVQSGSTDVLQRMNRGYSRERYLDLVDRLRSAVPGILLATDIIVGFPGETETDFERTCDLLERVRFANIFSFVYSPRPMTRAASLADDVPAAVKRRRLVTLQNLQRAIQLGLHRSFVGRDLRVLTSGTSPKGGGRYSGRTEGHQVVNFEASEDPRGRFVTVRITGCGPYSLHGTAV